MYTLVCAIQEIKVNNMKLVHINVINMMHGKDHFSQFKILTDNYIKMVSQFQSFIKI